MELRHLRYFVAIAEEQNVTRAAARLHVSQPTLSRQIRDLEDQFGIALFDRGAKAVRLTEAGRVFLTEARIVLEKDYVWLKPEIVAEIKFTEWTTGSVLRHPEFVSLRDDKSTLEISRES